MRGKHRGMEGEKEGEREKVRECSSTWWFASQMITVTELEPEVKPRAGTQSESSTWVTGIQVLEPPPLFPRVCISRKQYSQGERRLNTPGTLDLDAAIPSGVLTAVPSTTYKLCIQK